MGDQQRRRGGRGRTGRGGRIPRKGETPAAAHQEEVFASFPLDVTGPIRVPGALDEAGVTAAFERVLQHERRHAEAVKALAARATDPALADVRVQVERQRDQLEQLARDLGVGVSAAEGASEAGEEPIDLAASVRRSRLGWAVLQRLAYASGDRRIDRIVKPVLREKERHSRVLEGFAVTEAARNLFRDSEE